MASPVVFLQRATPDIPKMQEFYGELFGWDFTTRDGGEYFEVLHSLTSLGRLASLADVRAIPELTE